MKKEPRLSVWAVEKKVRGRFIPSLDCCAHNEHDATLRLINWQMGYPHNKFRIQKYVREGKRNGRRWFTTPGKIGGQRSAALELKLSSKTLGLPTVGPA